MAKEIPGVGGLRRKMEKTQLVAGYSVSRPNERTGSVVRTILAVLLVSHPFAAHAEPIPKVDVDAACRLVSTQEEFSYLYGRGSPAERYADCMSTNQDNYDLLKSDWNKLNASEQLACLMQPHKSQDSVYLDLAHCSLQVIKAQRKAKADAEAAEARKQIPRTEFRY